MNIDIICPLYNAEKFVLKLQKSLLEQKNVNINNIVYVLTESTDNTEQILKQNNMKYKKISKEAFSHSLTREEEAMKSEADILCFISQDIVIEDNYWLEKLVTPIINQIVDATYSRQLTKYNNIEKYIRTYNYPNESMIKTKKDIEKLGLKTFFFSDAASAVKTSVFKKLNGYDNKDLIINEDMYFAYKLILNGYKIKYCADSVVYHSHKFKLKSLYKRYKQTGKFFKENNYLNEYGTNNSGSKLARYVFKESLKDKNIKVLFRYPFDMGARFIGMKVGMR